MEAVAAAPGAARDLLARAAERLALAGGLALLAVMVVELASVGGGLFGRPILGDTEIVELLCGIAIACFMPWCQVQGGNVTVDFFTARLPARARDALDAVMHLAVAAIVAVLAWRLVLGGIDQYARGRVSMFLQLPQWWGYAGAGLASLAWTAACVRTSWLSLRRAAAPWREE